jgi:uncharacterized membrane protein YdcZ (DUF606 family)
VNTQNLRTPVIAGIVFLASLAALVVGAVLVLAAWIVGSQASNAWSIVMSIGVWAWLVGLPICMVSYAIFATTKPAFTK